MAEGQSVPVRGGSRFVASSRDAYVPSRRLPILYVSFAHLSLIVAAAMVALDPASVTGFYYHPLMIGVVHLVTLGWISSSILGFLLIVGPIGLRTPMPVGRVDYWVFGCYVVGVTGMVSHFWIEEYNGMAWSAGMVVVAIAHVATRVVPRVLRAPLPIAARLHIGLACINFVLAGVLGVAIGADREVDVISGSSMANLYAHAHLAGLGWATMMVIGVGYRLLPMVLPSAMPQSWRVAVSLVSVQIGTVGIVLTLLLDQRVAMVWAGIAAAGVVTFLASVAWMRRHRRPAPPARSTPDWSQRHVMQALAYLCLACVAGLALAVSPVSIWTARLATVYGVLALIGFLAQVIVGVGARMLPLFQWYTRFGASGFTAQPTSPHRMGSRLGRRLVFWLWTMAVPLLAVGMSTEQATLVGAGGLSLLGASVAQTGNLIVTLRDRRVSEGVLAAGVENLRTGGAG